MGDVLLSKHKRLERASCEGNEGKNIPGRGKSEGKGSVLGKGACLSCSKYSKKATVTEVQ